MAVSLVTGNARSLNYTFPPIVRMRNTCMAPGEASLEDMIKDIVGTIRSRFRWRVKPTEKCLTLWRGHGFMIRDGKIAELVKDVKLLGNVFTTLGEHRYD